MASKVSDEVFSAFGWRTKGPINQNWSCSLDYHEKTSHPSDVVFWYDDPYSNNRIFINTDLKSYGANTISKANTAAAVSSLGRTIECANAAAPWRELYGSDETNWRCDGLLFVYNHDAGFSGDFAKFVREIDVKNFRIPPRRRMVLVGPLEVQFLANVAADIMRLRGQKALPDQDACEYWYPDLVTVKRRAEGACAATIEMLTGPWIIMRPRPEQHHKLEFVIWYRGDGSTIDEFKYLLDYLFRYQLLNVDTEASVRVRLVTPVKEAVANFARAKEQYSYSLHGLAEKRLANVSYQSLTQIVTRFSEIELGMERG
jgi:hypothetical protein